MYHYFPSVYIVYIFRLCFNFVWDILSIGVVADHNHSRPREEIINCSTDPIEKARLRFREPIRSITWATLSYCVEIAINLSQRNRIRSFPLSATVIHCLSFVLFGHGGGQRSNRFLPAALAEAGLEVTFKVGHARLFDWANMLQYTQLEIER